VIELIDGSFLNESLAGTAYIFPPVLSVDRGINADRPFGIPGRRFLTDWVLGTRAAYWGYQNFS